MAARRQADVRRGGLGEGGRCCDDVAERDRIAQSHALALHRAASIASEASEASEVSPR